MGKVYGCFGLGFISEVFFYHGIHTRSADDGPLWNAVDEEICKHGKSTASSRRDVAKSKGRHSAVVRRGKRGIDILGGARVRERVRQVI